jgi:hypothetical protein
VASGNARTRYRVALAAVGTLMLLFVVLVPFAIGSALADALGVPETRVFPISPEPRGPAAGTHADLHLVVTALDAVQQMATVRVSGSEICQSNCTSNDQVLLFSLAQADSGSVAIPPSATVTLPPTATQISQTVQLPVHGQAIRYPFDQYRLRLGVSVQRPQQGGAQQTLPPAEAAGRIFLTIQADVPGVTMTPPITIDPGALGAESDRYQFLYVRQFNFLRPPYLWVLTVLLVLLAAGSAAYAVFLRPLGDLVVNAGGVILGLWGIRSILTTGGPSIVTAVDLSLSAVILFLLGAITARTLWFVFQRSELKLFHRRPRQ